MAATTNVVDDHQIDLNNAVGFIFQTGLHLVRSHLYQACLLFQPRTIVVAVVVVVVVAVVVAAVAVDAVVAVAVVNKQPSLLLLLLLFPTAADECTSFHG